MRGGLASLEEKSILRKGRHVCGQLASLDALVKGTSLQEDWRKTLLSLEDPGEDTFLLRVTRAPSSSNVADFLSRNAHVRHCSVDALAEADLGENPL